MGPQAEEKDKSSDDSRVNSRIIRPYTGEIVISGISGRYPDSDSVPEFQENLMNKVNMVTVDNRRWEPGFWDLPLYMGKLKRLDAFDAEFFGIHSKSAESMDPQLRIMLEVVYEALVDAGESLASIKGSRTGVYVGVTVSEAEHAWMDKDYLYILTGVAHCMIPNRISYFLDVRGPSCAYDTACSSSLVCVEAAELHMRSGVVDSAVVAVCNLIMRPSTTKAFVNMSMLGKSSGCKTFDADGDGFVRAEAVSAILLKRAADAKRVYGTLMGSLTNNDGYSKDGLTFPNRFAQEELIRDLYSSRNIDPKEIKFIECHGTGTPAGDPQETSALGKAICAYRKEPLLVASTKTNMGHSEVASGMCALTKVVIAMHTGVIPPNLHFNTPHPNIPGLFDGSLKVVTEPTPWEGGLVGLNSFGMGGSNAHVVLRSHEKKVNATHPASDKPRLFVYSARTEEGLKNILDDAQKHASNVEFHTLCEQSANTALGSMPYRGATLLNAEQEFTEMQRCSSKPRELWFVYSGMGSQWVGMGRSLMVLDSFRQSMEESSAILKTFGVDVMDIIMNGKEDCYKPILPPFVCIVTIQLALTDLLTSMGIRPDGIVGHSLGETGCAYADGCLTKREALMSAYWRGQCVVEAKPAPGKMAAVGLTWEEAHQMCPPGVVPACHNAEDSVTISGAAEPVIKFMEELTAKGIFVKEVNSSNVGYHSYFMSDVAVNLKAQLDKVLNPKPRTKRWVSTSVPEDRWDEPLAQYPNGAYYANNLRSPVLFCEGLQKIPSNAIIIEVAPAALLLSVVKRSVGPQSLCIGLQKRNHENNLEFFFTSLGKCFANGVSMNPLAVYPPIEFPVSKGTPMLSGMISQAWDHSVEWNVPKPEDYGNGSSASSSTDTTYEIDVSDDSPDHYLSDHCVDERNLFPATGCLVLAWKTLASMKGEDYQDMPVSMSNVRIHQATFLNASSPAKVTVTIMPRSGEFQVCENENVLASGHVTAPQGHILETEQYAKTGSLLDDKPATQVLTGREVYRELIASGYEYGPYFQGVLKSGVDGKDADIKWDGRWISYLDAVLQMVNLARPGAHQALPVLLESVNIDPNLHPAAPDNDAHYEVLPGCYDSVLDLAAAGGVEIRGLHTIRAPRQLTHDPPRVNEVLFLPYHDVKAGERSAPYAPPTLSDYADACVELSRQGITHWLAQDKEDLLPHKDCLKLCLDHANKTLKKSARSSSLSEAKAKLDAIVSNKNGLKIPETGIHSIFSMFYDIPLTSEVFPTLRPKFHDYRFEIWDDPILASTETEEIVRLCIDTVSDNVTTQAMNILEPGAVKSVFFRHAFPMALDRFTIKDYRYFVADKVLIDDAIKYPVKMLMFDSADPENFPEAQQETIDLLILKNVLHYQKDLDVAIAAYSEMVKPGGFIFVEELVDRQSVIFPIESFVTPSLMNGLGGPEGERILGCYYSDTQWRAFFARHGLEEIIHRSNGVSTSIYLLRKPVEILTPPRIICIDDLNFSWLEEVKAKFADLQNEPQDARLWLVATKEISGISGFFHSLRWEIGSGKLRCAYICNTKPGSKAPEISAGSAEFKELMKKDLVMNVYKDGRWGTFRLQTLSEETRLSVHPREHVFADCYTPNDVLSLKWFDSPLKMDQQNGKRPLTRMLSTDTEVCAVYCAGLNPRDLLLANGTVKVDDLPEKMIHGEGVLGIEFSGRDSAGRRVMGLCSPPALASSVRCCRSSLWSVPDHWTLEEAATVPVAYATAFHALVTKARLKQGETVFVQAGWTPVGQAAIAVALSNGCETFTLTRNAKEADMLKTMYPQLKDRNICSSQDLTFQRYIRTQTGTKGVDVVVNFSNDDALKARLALLAKGSRFVDVSFKADNKVHIAFSSTAWKHSSFHSVQLDSLIDGQGSEWTELSSLLQTGIQSGVVKPLRRSVFPMDKLVDAFKGLDEDKHSEKILIKVRAEEQQKVTLPQKSSFPGVHRTWFDPAKSYVIIGGLGGLGLEVSDWMIRRGVRKLLLTSRKGVMNGYQAKKIEYLRSLGAEVEVAAITVNTEETVQALVKLATKLGPIGGFFNMGLVLKDAPILEQTVEACLETIEVKATTTALLDQVSREKPVRASLDHFVVFSSAVGYHGHMGQSSYAFGNCVAERICERRRAGGLPGVAIEWGPVADVGYVGTMGNHAVVCGKLPQRLQSVKTELDFCLSQKSPAVVSSYVIADKSIAAGGEEESVEDYIVRAVGKILGVKDVKNMDGDKEFVELGVDSLMSIEVRQLLERELDIVLNSKEIQLLTFNSLRSLLES